jgi:hypothetical protein
VTSQGSPHTRLRRAIAQRNLLVALATATELPRVPLEDALALCLLILDKDPGRYEAAAVRWHSRFCREIRPSLPEAQLVLAALHALSGTGHMAACRSLIALFDEAGHERLGSVLAQWSEGGQ